MGFSTSRWRPRASSAQPTSACAAVGTARTAASMRSASGSSSLHTRQPCSRPTCSAASRRASWIPTSSTPGSWPRIRAWCRPRAPVPTTPTRSGARSVAAIGDSIRRGAATAAAPPRQAPDDAAPRGLDEGDQVIHVGMPGVLGAQHGERLRGVEARAGERPDRGVQPPQRLLLEALALEAHPVEAIAGRLVAHRLDERQRVLHHHREAADVAVAADPAVLMDGAEGADGRVVADLDVAGERGAVGEDHPVADPAVVGDVAVRHEQAVAADRGQTAALAGAAVDGHELPKVIAVADLQAGALAAELEILGVEAEAGVGEDAVAAPDPRRPLELRAGADLGALADLDLGADHGVWSDHHTVGQLGTGVDDRGGMDARRRHTLPLSRWDGRGAPPPAPLICSPSPMRSPLPPRAVR